MNSIFNLLGWIFYPVLKLIGNKLPKCRECKERMEKRGLPRLFLIPVHSDHDYKESAAYYLNNCSPIGSEAEIPTGQRACRLWELSCAACGARQVMVEDFLRVRDSEVLEKRSFYNGGDFDKLLCQ